MTLEEINVLASTVRIQVFYDNQTGATRLIVAGCTLAQFTQMFSLAEQTLLEHYPGDYQI